MPEWFRGAGDQKGVHERKKRGDSRGGTRPPHRIIASAKDSELFLHMIRTQTCRAAHARHCIEREHCMSAGYPDVCTLDDKREEERKTASRFGRERADSPRALFSGCMDRRCLTTWFQSLMAASHDSSEVAFCVCTNCNGNGLSGCRHVATGPGEVPTASERCSSAATQPTIPQTPNMSPI